MTARVDYEIERGDTAKFTGTAKRTDKTIADLTGATVRFTAKRKLTDADGDAVIAKTATVLDAEAGVFRVTIDPGDTSSLSACTLSYDVQITEADGTVTTTQKGTLAIVLDATIES